MSGTIAVGIVVHAEPARFLATLDAVRRTVPATTEIVIIPDHPDPPTASALAGIFAIAGLRDARLLPSPVRQGGAACLNLLFGQTDADTCVLLESGCIPAEGWLERLMEGLAADARNGLAGPSTNRSWNEQAPAEAAGCRAEDAGRVANRLRERWGSEARTLATLYSLADFCYAVRRDVWAALGGADEGYGAGPCWEMDFNARAARAGWRGVWVLAAFVWRAPFTTRRARDERRLMDASRRRYQDRLCGLRLRGERSGYEPHCRGDSCEHFAPADLIPLRITPSAPRLSSDPVAPLVLISSGKPASVRVDEWPSPESAPILSFRTVSDSDDPRPTPAATERTAEHPFPLPACPSSALAERENRDKAETQRHAETVAASALPPLISCIMPTSGRPEWVRQAIRYFLAQDYPQRELIILDDEGRDPENHTDPRIRVEHLPAGTTIGAKRNRGVELARGDLIAQWDDDDWYAPDRLSAQAAPILAGTADVTALRTELFFDLQRWEFWSCTDALHRRLFVHDVHGGTLMYRRALWGPRAVYPPASLAEDAAFLARAVRHGARLRRIDTPGLFIYLRHGGNAWRFGCGDHVDARGWKRVGEPPHLAPERAWYEARAASLGPPSSSLSASVSVGSPAALSAADGSVLVSCVMPTADRRHLVPRAIEYFLRQSYAARELVIVDDGKDSVEDLIPSDPRIRYFRTAPCGSLGAKRNLACSLARGALIAHWDDDDWIGEHRIATQVAALNDARADVCGLSTVRYFDPEAGRAWEYRWPAGSRMWVGGNTLLYRRAAWERRPFPELNEGEDTRWVWAQRSVTAMRDGSWFAAMIHARNTSPKRTDGGNWHPISPEIVARAMGNDAPFYAALRRSDARLEILASA